MFSRWEKNLHKPENWRQCCALAQSKTIKLSLLTLFFMDSGLGCATTLAETLKRSSSGYNLVQPLVGIRNSRKWYKHWKMMICCFETSLISKRQGSLRVVRAEKGRHRDPSIGRCETPREGNVCCSKLRVVCRDSQDYPISREREREERERGR